MWGKGERGMKCHRASSLKLLSALVHAPSCHILWFFLAPFPSSLPSSLCMCSETATPTRASVFFCSFSYPFFDDLSLSSHTRQLMPFLPVVLIEGKTRERGRDFDIFFHKISALLLQSWIFRSLAAAAAEESDQMGDISLSLSLPTSSQPR